MTKFYPHQKTKDHVLVNITLSVMIGVDETQDDTPPEFCNLVREAIKETGGIILASSIVGQKRLHYKGSTREQIINDKESPLFT